MLSLALVNSEVDVRKLVPWFPLEWVLSFNEGAVPSTSLKTHTSIYLALYLNHIMPLDFKILKWAAYREIAD